MHNWKISEYLQGIMKRLSKKDKSLYEQLLKKIDEVINCEDVEHYKNLSYELSDFKGVHIDSHFVLTFKINEKDKLIKFEDLQHHDIIYKR